VGCGIDFTRQAAFFTKNGAFLGPVFDNLEGQLYPSVGMRTPGEVVRANFGQAPFRFDIESFVAARQVRLLKSIQETNVPDRLLIKSSNEEPRIPPEPVVPEAEQSTLSTPTYNAALDDTVAALVSAYLTFHGFVETAQAFEAQRLADRKRHADLSPLTRANGLHHENGDVEMNEESTIRGESSVMGARQKICRCVVSGQSDEALELLEDSFPAETAAPIGPLAEIVFRLRCQHFIELILSSAAQSSPKGKTRGTSPSLGALDLALDYGRELQLIYGADERESIKEGLRRTFALWAYDDPKNAEEDEVRWLASQASRDKLADDLNAAILGACDV
jgi:Ran-binding protein 9/10